jgi:transcriptional regulator with XRE-family HTH domain
MLVSLGERLRTTREKKGWSQRALARQANIRYATISELENGIRSAMNTDTAKKIARSLGVSVDYLIGTFEEEEEEGFAAISLVVCHPQGAVS